MINVVIVDDHRMFAAGLKSILENEIGLKVMSAVNATETLSLISNHDIHLVLMDIQMPNSTMNGIELTKCITSGHPEIKILVISMDKSVETVDAIIEAGAHGYLVKDSGDEVLLNAIKTLKSGEEFWDPSMMKLMVDARRQGNGEKKEQLLKKEVVLTKRESEVLKWLAAGLSSKEIADELCIGTSTVDTHRKNLIAKFQAKNSTDVVMKAQELGLL